MGVPGIMGLRNVVTPDRLRERTIEIGERDEALKKTEGSFDGLTYWQEKHLKRLVKQADRVLVQYTNRGATEMILPGVYTEVYAQWLTAHYRKRGFGVASKRYRGGMRTGYVSGWVVHLTW